MASLLLNILFVAIGVAVGVIGGWCLRGNAPPVDTRPSPSPEAEPPRGMAQVETLMGRLHQLTSSVAADIGEHSHRVQEINQDLSDGADVVLVVEQLVEANEKMQVQLQSAEKRLQSQAREIESHIKEARTDALTRLANRRAFDDEIRQCMAAYQEKGTPFCVMMVDVDHFKKFNDTYGHQAGDEVLKGVARVLRREFAGNELVCRYGGEEFAVIFPHRELAAVIARAEQGRAAIGRELFEYEDMDLKVTASGGLAGIRPGETSDHLVRRADDSLYVGKSNGRNCGYWHDGSESLPMDQFSGARQGVPADGDAAEHWGETVYDRECSVFRLVPEDSEQTLDRRDRIAGLSDRDTLCKDLERRLAEQQRRGVPASLLLVEIDKFADLVEDYGAKAAELALRAAAQILKLSKRDMDHAARFDDAVFAVLLPGTNLAEACVVAERMRVAIENCRVPVCGEQLQFTVSLGVTSTQKNDEVPAVVHRAEQALYDAVTGGNRVRSIPRHKASSDTTSPSTQPARAPAP